MRVGSLRGGYDTIALPAEQRAEVIDDSIHIVSRHLVARSYAQQSAGHIHDAAA